MQSPSGIVALPYVVENGLAIYQGDVVLGEAAAVRRQEEQRSLAIVGWRWPSTIRFAFDPALPAADKATFLSAVSAYKALTPITFTEVAFPASSPHVAILVTTSTVPNVSSSNTIGSPASFGDDPVLAIFPGHPIGVVEHELGHVLGLFHEQSRFDRDNTVLFSPQCTTAASQYAKLDLDTATPLAPYDLNSMMQYSSNSFCMPAIPGTPAVPGTNCVCLPLVKAGASNQTGFGTPGFISQGATFSIEDLNTLWRRYEPKLGTNEAQDGFGASMIVADFNGDGYSDIAVGAPGDQLVQGSGLTSGAVYLFRGTSGGPVAWRVIRQSGLSAEAVNERFGASLAVGDFDGNGIPDLFVGAPGDIIGGVAGAPGSVFAYAGGTSGLTAFARIDQTGLDINTNGDEFGAALTVADFDGDGKSELAVGAPGKARGGASNVGAVYLFKNGLTPWQKLGIGDVNKEPELAGNRFGHALTTGDLSGDGIADLVVGAPQTTVAGKAGLVEVFKVSSVSGKLTGSQVIRELTSDSPAPAAGDAFGTSLAIADFDGVNVINELAVGAPGKDAPLDSGRVVLFTRGATLMTQKQLISTNAIPMKGDRFGEALGVMDFNADKVADLLIGMPGRTTTLPGSGAAALFQGRNLPLTQTQFYVNTNASADRFGSSFASGNLDQINGLKDFVVGMPGASSGAGAFALFTGSILSPTPVGAGVFDQATQTPE